MPQQTVYIRNDDLDKWKALTNKAAWISMNLEKESLMQPEIERPTQPNIHWDIIQGKQVKVNESDQTYHDPILKQWKPLEEVQQQ